MITCHRKANLIAVSEKLPTIRVCHSCNNSFSSDEEYFIAFFGSVLAGTVKPEDQVLDWAEKALRNNLSLQSQIEERLRVEKDGYGKDCIFFIPDIGLIENSVVKNARGHILFEHGQPEMGLPSHVSIQRIPNCTLNTLKEFEKWLIALSPQPQDVESRRSGLSGSKIRSN